MTNRAALGAAAVFFFSSSTVMADRVIAVEAAATSVAKGKDDKFAAWRAVDGSSGTAWCEGKDDEGLDEKLTLTLAEPISAKRIDLYVGIHLSSQDYKDNNRPSKLYAAITPKKGDPVSLLGKAVPMTSDYDKLVKLDLKPPRTMQVIELGLAGVTRGEKLKVNNTCFTDVSLVDDKGETVTFVYGLPADAMASLPAAVSTLRTAIAGCDEKALSTAVKFPLAHRISAEEESRNLKHKNAKALAKACTKGDIPKIPAEADRPALSANGFARVSLDINSTELIRFDMQWNKGSWQMVSIESY
jgi:hypothetical protein